MTKISQKKRKIFWFLSEISVKTRFKKGKKQQKNGKKNSLITQQKDEEKK